MRDIVYADRIDGGYVLVGRDASAQTRRSGLILMHRPDLDVIFVEVPRVKGESVGDFLRYRLRTLYPGRPEETAFDYRVITSGAKRLAAVFVTSLARLESYHTFTGTLYLPASAIPAALPGPFRQGGVFVFWHQSWVEILTIPGRRHAVEAGSTIIRTDGDRDVGRVVAEIVDMAPNGIPLQIICPDSLTIAMQQSLGSREAVLHDRDAIVARLRPNTVGLFTRPRPSRIPRRAIRVQVLLLVALLLGCWMFRRAVADRVAYAERLTVELEGLQSRTAGALADRGRLEERRGKLDALTQRRPIDHHGILSELSRVLGPDTRILSLLIEGGQFQLEAEGTGALELVGRFGKSRVFSQVRLIQTVPGKGSSRELFRLSGRTHAQ